MKIVYSHYHGAWYLTMGVAAMVVNGRMYWKNKEELERAIAVRGLSPALSPEQRGNYVRA